MERNLSLKSIARGRIAARSVVALVVLFGLTFSCSGDGDGRAPKKPSAPGEDAEWAIHVYVGEPGSWKRLDFVPVPELSFPAAPHSGTGPLPASPKDLWAAKAETAGRVGGMNCQSALCATSRASLSASAGGSGAARARAPRGLRCRCRDSRVSRAARSRRRRWFRRRVRSLRQQSARFRVRLSGCTR